MKYFFKTVEVNRVQDELDAFAKQGWRVVNVVTVSLTDIGHSPAMIGILVECSSSGSCEKGDNGA